MGSTIPDFARHMGGVPVGTQYGWKSGAKTWFVDGDKSSGGDGTSPDQAFSLISTAITAASAWDVIYIMPKTWTSTYDGYPGLGVPYAESNTIAWAKQGLALIGAANSDIPGTPHAVVLQETASATTSPLTVNAPLCAFENLVFERATETAGQIVLSGETAGTNGAHGANIYNCYFYYGQGTTGPGTTGGAIIGTAQWGLHVANCQFLGCLIGIYYQSGGPSAGDFEVTGCTFKSRLLTASDIKADIYVYTQGSTNILLRNNYHAHLIPAGGAPNRWISIQADIRQGLIANSYFGGAGDTAYTQGSAGTGITCPNNVGVSGCYDGTGALMAHA